MAKEKNNQPYINKEQDRRLSILEQERKEVFKHIATVNTELTEVKTDVAWLKRYYWIVVTASVSGLIAGIMNLLK